MIHIFGYKPPCESLGMGVFDGLHAAHQVLLDNCSHLLTFWPHPDVFLSKNADIKMLTTLRELRYYVKNLLVLRFNQHIADMPADQFLASVIADKISPKQLVVGYDFRFGYRQEGDLQLLKSWTQKNRIRLKIIDPIQSSIHSLNNTKAPIKSSLIRNLIQDDQFDAAMTLLGHSYLVIGKVIMGDQIGRRLGFPTANLQLPALKMVPCDGVYQGRVLIQKEWKSSLVYVGKRPTFGKKESRVEVYVLDFDGDLYGRQLKVFVERKIRSDQIFAGKDALIAQIRQDIDFIRARV